MDHVHVQLYSVCSIPAVTDSGESLKQRQNILVVTRKSVCVEGRLDPE